MVSTDSQLSAKHEAFAVLCSNGLAAGAAYARIYPKSSKATAETDGPALLRKAQVKARVVELQAKVEKEFTLTRIDWLESLLRIAKKAEETEDFSASRGCLREIGLAMPGWYKPVENNVTVPGLDELLASIIKPGIPREPRQTNL